MIAVVECEKDPASLGIVHELLRLAPWREEASFLGKPVRSHEKLRIVTIPSLHIHREALDAELAQAGLAPDALVFASRHAAKSGRDSLTVHPLGNWQEAVYGGKPHEFCPAAPGLQSDALRLLARHAAGLDYDVTLEATHHGPWLATPAFFIEAGSDLRAWNDRRAHEAIARTILELPRTGSNPVVVGIGGGHYAPRHGDLVRRREVDIAHIASDHALQRPISDPTWRAAFERSVTREFVVDERSRQASEAAVRLESLGFRRRRPEEFAPAQDKA